MCTPRPIFGWDRRKVCYRKNKIQMQLRCWRNRGSDLSRGKARPGRDYMCHPTIKTFLEKPSLDPLASDKSKRVDYRGSSASNFELIMAKTWFGRGTMICLDPSQVEAIFSSENLAQGRAATLSSAEVITFGGSGQAGSEVLRYIRAAGRFPCAVVS